MPIEPTSKPSSSDSEWSEFVEEMASNGGAIDPNKLVQEVLRESYKQTSEDLREYAEKVDQYNQHKPLVRDYLDPIRDYDETAQNQATMLHMPKATQTGQGQSSKKPGRMSGWLMALSLFALLGLIAIGFGVIILGGMVLSKDGGEVLNGPIKEQETATDTPISPTTVVIRPEETEEVRADNQSTTGNQPSGNVSNPSGPTTVPDQCADHGGTSYVGDPCVCPGIIDHVVICADGTKFDNPTTQSCVPNETCAGGGSTGGSVDPTVVCGCGLYGAPSTGMGCSNGVIEECNVATCGCKP